MSAQFSIEAIFNIHVSVSYFLLKGRSSMQNVGLGIVAHQNTHSSKKTKADFERFYQEKKLEEKAETVGLNKAEKAELAFIKATNILNRLQEDTFVKY